MFPLSFEIVSSCSNALLVLQEEGVKAVLVLSQRDVSQGLTHCCLDVLQVVKAVSPDLGFQLRKRPKIARGEVRTVLRVGPQPLSHVDSKKIVQGQC